MGMLQAISLFTNCGAGDVGFRRAGFRFVVLAEKEDRRLAVAWRNHPRAKKVPGDLRETWPQVVEAWRKLKRERSPDLLASCPPCQGMSTARADRGKEADPKAGTKDARNLLVLPIAEVAKALRPRVIVVENVPAFFRRKVVHPGTGEGISAALLLIGLLEDEYAVHPLLTDLADFGVPQTRVRAFLTFIRRDLPALAILEDLKSVPYPVPAHSADHGGDGPVTLGEVLAKIGLPPLDSAGPDSARDVDRPLHFVPVWEADQYEMVAAIPAGSGRSAWQNDKCPGCMTIVDHPDTAVCPSCFCTLRRPIVKEEDGIRLVKGFRRTSYRRMSPDMPAPTITTASGRVGSSRTIHPLENRVLSPLECAVLQTFPVDFEWGDVLEDAGVLELRAMIGEAVPPLFTERHGRVLWGLLREDPPDCLLPGDDPRSLKAWKKLGDRAKSDVE